MNEHSNSADNSLALTSVEQNVVQVPWCYTTASWELLDDQQYSKRQGAFSFLAWLLVLALGGLSGIVIWQFSPRPMDGHLQTVVSGKLFVQDGRDAPWFEASSDRFIRQGARLRAEPGTVALVSFDDGAQWRIESEGEWVCSRLAQSRNTRIKRVRIRQLDGQASYLSAPPQSGVDARITVQLQDVQLLLRGVATVRTDKDQAGQMTLWQGTGDIRGYDQRLAAQAGDQLRYDPAQWQIEYQPGTVSQ